MNLFDNRNFDCVRSKESLYEKKNFFNESEPIKPNENVINSMKFYRTIFSILEKHIAFIHRC